jgi:hypothetical protein
MIKEIAAFFGKDKMIPKYQQRANLLRQRAINESLSAGVFVDKEKGVKLVEDKTTTIITLPDKRIVEFAIGNDGLAFARIEGNKYYPLDTKLPEDLLSLANKYDKLSASRFRRFLVAAGEQNGDISFNLLITMGLMCEWQTILYLSAENLLAKLQDDMTHLEPQTN